MPSLWLISARSECLKTQIGHPLITGETMATAAANKLLSPTTVHHRPLSSHFSLSVKLKLKESICSPWPRSRPRRSRGITVSASIEEAVLVSSSITTAPILIDIMEQVPSSSSPGYSQASYYTSLGLFVISVPGLWSLIKRSVKSKIVKKTFVEGGEKKREANQMAGEILSFFTRNNFAVADRGETITFEGMMAPSRGQAALLTFCTCISLASVGLVLTITYPDFGNNWFWITALSPLAGAYYWKRASRKEEIKIKMVLGEDTALSEIVVQGDDVQVEQLRKELQLSEKGMVYVKGLFET